MMAEAEVAEAHQGAPKEVGLVGAVTGGEEASVTVGVASVVAVTAEEESEVVVQEEVVKARAMVVADLGAVVG